MKILFTMVLTIGLLLTSAMAQDPPKRLTDCQIAQPIRMPGGTIAKRELAQQNLSQPHRGLLDSLDINSQQWDVCDSCKGIVCSCGSCFCSWEGYRYEV